MKTWDKNTRAHQRLVKGGKAALATTGMLVALGGLSLLGFASTLKQVLKGPDTNWPDT